VAILREQWALVLNTSANTDTYTSSESFTVGGGADHVLVLAVQFTDQTGALNFANTTVFAGATQMTLAAGLSFANGQQPGAGIYYLVDPAAGSTTFTANVKDGSNAAATVRGCSMTAFELSGIDPTDVLEDADAVTVGSGTDARIELTTANAGCFVIVGGAIYGGGHTPWTPVGCTELLDGQTGTTNFNDHGYFVGQLEVATASTFTVGADPTTEDSKAFAAAAFNPGASGPEPISGTAIGAISLSGSATTQAAIAAGAAGALALGGSGDLVG